MNRFYRAVQKMGILKHPSESLYDKQGAPADTRLHIKYLGTAGFIFTAGEHTLVVDPYVSRPGLRQTLQHPLLPNATLIRELIPKASDVLVGHSHHDHVLDAPELCHQTGARLIGSSDVCQVGRAAGLPESQLVQTTGREDIPCCGGHVRGLPAQHGRVYFNKVSLPGTIDAPPPWPPRYTDLRHGLVLNWFIEMGGVRVVHIDSADFFEEELKGVECDVLCLCAIGRAYRPNYVKDAVRLLKPKVVIPCHWDLFSTPIHDRPFLLPQVNLQGMIDEIYATGVRPVVLPLLGEWGF